MKTERTQTRVARQALGVVALLLVFFTAPAASQARVGGLDPTFGDGGRVTTPLRLTDAVETTLAPDGSIVMLSGRQLLRFLGDGRLDPAFGQEGQLPLPERVDGLPFEPRQLAVDGQGRPVVFGDATDSSQRFSEPIGLWSIPATWPVVLRLERDGDLDPTFGEGKGYVRSDFGMRSTLDPKLSLALATAGRVDLQDRPIFMVEVAERGAPCNVGKSTYAWYPRAIVRLTSTGAVDSTFGGGDGSSSTAGNWNYPGLEVDASGGSAAAVGTVDCRLGGNRIFRLDPSGAPSSGFGAAGSRVYPGMYLTLMEPSGALILDGAYRKARVLARTLPNGKLDPAFGSKGRVALRMPFGTGRLVEPVGVDARRRVLLVGSFNLPKPRKATRKHGPTTRKAKRRHLRSFLAVGRLTPSGRPDLGFGRRGWIVTRFKRPLNIEPQAALDPQGRLVVVAGSWSADQPPGPRQIVIARYLLQG